MADLSAVYLDIGTSAVTGTTPVTGPNGVPFWGDSPESWQTVTLGGKVIPGTCEVSGSAGLRVDRKHVPGTHGARQTYLGYEPSEFELELTLWTEQHLRDFESLMPRIRPKAATGRQPSALPVEHPALAVLGIRYLTVLKVSVPQRDGDRDVYRVKLSCLEFIQKGNANKGKVTDPNLLDHGPGAIAEKLAQQQKAAATPSKTAAGP